MTDLTLTCSKCGGEMVQGFVVADSFGAGATAVSTWVDGPPLKSFWTGTKLTGARRIHIGTFRCAACGYLEAYARPEFAPK